jgi:hypothetical protein
LSGSKEAQDKKTKRRGVSIRTGPSADCLTARDLEGVSELVAFGDEGDVEIAI